MSNRLPYPIQLTHLVIVILLILVMSSSYITSQQKPIVSKNSNTNLSLSNLGRWLFFDNRLSYNQQKSCASCHDPKFCFSDGYRTSAGTDGFNVKHNAPSLINAVFLQHYTWSDSSIHQLEQQMRNPLFNEEPRELGMKGNEALLLKRLQSDVYYQKAFKALFPEQIAPLNINNIITAIAAYERTLISFNSKYDRYLKGEKKALNQDELAGMKLYQSTRLQCANCHDKPTLSEQSKLVYANNGLYNIHNMGQYPANDQGLYDYTGKEADRGKFRIPSLRNVLLTAPYTHNGSVQTISEMIDIYAASGRVISDGPYQGDGRKHLNKSSYIKGFQLTNIEKGQLVAFLNALTDTSNLRLTHWKDPIKNN